MGPTSLKLRSGRAACGELGPARVITGAAISLRMIGAAVGVGILGATVGFGLVAAAGSRRCEGRRRRRAEARKPRTSLERPARRLSRQAWDRRSATSIYLLTRWGSAVSRAHLAAGSRQTLARSQLHERAVEVDDDGDDEGLR